MSEDRTDGPVVLLSRKDRINSLSNVIGDQVQELSDWEDYSLAQSGSSRVDLQRQLIKRNTPILQRIKNNLGGIQGNNGLVSLAGEVAGVIDFANSIESPFNRLAEVTRVLKPFLASYLESILLEQEILDLHITHQEQGTEFSKKEKRKIENRWRICSNGLFDSSRESMAGTGEIAKKVVAEHLRFLINLDLIPEINSIEEYNSKKEALNQWGIYRPDVLTYLSQMNLLS